MLTLAMLRNRWTSFVGAFVTLLLGVTILATTALLLANAQPEVPARFAGTPALVLSPAAHDPANGFAGTVPWSAERLATIDKQLSTIAGVTAVVPDRSFYVQAVLDGHPTGHPDAGDPLGHNWSAAALAPYHLTAGRPPVADTDVVVDRTLGLRPGSPITLLTAAGPGSWTVSGVADGTGFYVADAVAARMSAGVRVIGLRTAPDSDIPGVRAAAQRAVGAYGTVVSGDARRALEPQSRARVRWLGEQVLVALLTLATFTSVFVVASTFAFTVMQRRRDIGLLRAVGATPRQVRRMMYGEALVTGVLAGAGGGLLGIALTPPVGRALVDVGFEPTGFTPHARALPLLAAFAVGLLVALVGVGSAARRGSRIAPMEALREAVIERRSMSRFRWIAGVLSLVGGVLFGAATASAHADSLVNLALYCAFALILGLALLAPALIPPIVRLVTWPVHSSRGAIGVLVRESATSAVRRTASTAAPVLVTVSFAALISVTAQTSSHAYHTQDAARVPASRVLVPDGTPGLSDAAVATVPGISLLISTAYASGNTPIGAVGVPAGTVPGLDGGTVAAADWALSQYGWRVGGVVPITFADGTTVPMRVVSRLITAIPGGIALDRKTLRAHDPSALTDAVYAAGSAGPPPGAVGARLVDVTTYAGRLDAQDDRLIWLFVLLLVGVSVGYTAIAIANTLLMATAHRAGDFRALHRIGATRRQISWAVAGESTLVVGIGTLLAGVVSSVALAAVRSGLAESTGVPISLVVPWPTLLAVTAACLLLAQLASVVPARIALSRRISPVS